MKRLLHIILTVLSFINICVFYAIRSTWFFVNQTVGDKQIWAQMIFVLFILIFLTNVIMLYKVRSFKLKHLLPGILTLMFVVANIYIISEMGSGYNLVMRNILLMIPGLAIVTLLILLIQTKYKINNIFKIAAAFAMLAIIFVPQMNLLPVKITSGPNFTYAGDDLVVTWTTNVNSTGFVEVGIDDNFKTTAPSEDGLIISDTTHFEVTLKDIQDGDFIRVGSRKIINHYQNNVVYGQTVYSDFVKYENTRDDSEITFYVISDTHERTDLYGKYLDVDDYDFVIYNGDTLSSIDNRELIASEFLQHITVDDELKPYYFVRGNHETRGAAALTLDDYLAMEDDRYYYTFTYGPVFFVVLDTAEDKADDDAEYSGLADFEVYRQEQTRWLKSVVDAKEYEDYKYVIAISHIPLLKDDEMPYKEQWMKLLGEMQADVLLSGHTHKAEMVETESVPVVTGGGYVTSRDGHEALKILAEDDLIIEIITEEGEARETFLVD